MICLCCQGNGWLRREVDATAVYGRPMTTEVSRVCPYCKGKGIVREYQSCGKDQASKDSEENS